MELREFIKQTLIQITDGVNEGHKYIVDNDLGEGVKDHAATTISFDVAVSSSESDTTGAGGKITVANIFSAGAKQETSAGSGTTNRIQFEILLHIETKS